MGRRAFISYARDDADRVAAIERRLRQLDYTVWMDQALKGGQAWWDEILKQIRECDIFIAIVSPASIDSRACYRERMYADALGKPILPVAIVPPNQAIPSELSRRQVVDYSVPSEDAAFRLASVLVGLPPAPPLQGPLPDPPDVPLSYLAALVDSASSPEPLVRGQQLEMLDQLESGIRAADAEEREGAWHVMRLLEDRPDLYADTQRRIDRLRSMYGGRASEPETARSAGASAGGAGQTRAGPAHGTPPAATGGAAAGLAPGGAGVGEPTAGASAGGAGVGHAAGGDGGAPPRQGAAPRPAATPGGWHGAPSPAAAAAPPPYSPPAQPRPVHQAGLAAQGPVRPGDVPAPSTPGEAPPDNFLVWAILATVFCCLPVGVVSIVFASQVNTKWASGDRDGARQAAQKARSFAIWAVVAGAAGGFLYLVFAVLANAGY